jgi:hypothetical protein
LPDEPFITYNSGADTIYKTQGELRMKCTMMLARFPGGFSEHPDSSSYVMDLAIASGARGFVEQGERWRRYRCDHERIDSLILWNKSDTPITMVRNLCVEDALSLGVDYLLMIDSDMHPDEPNLHCKPFYRVAFDFLWQRGAPACIAAPYVGPGHHQNIFVFRWRNTNNYGLVPGNFKIDQYTREEAVERSGIEKVAALPTGLIMYDMRVFERLDPTDRGYFYYEYDTNRTEKHSTEDVTLTRDLSLAWQDNQRAGCYCAWDCWAEHIKLTHFGKPTALTVESVGKALHAAYRNGKSIHESVVSVVGGDGERHVHAEYPVVE